MQNQSLPCFLKKYKTTTTKNYYPMPYAEEFMLLNCGAEEDSWEYVGQQGHQTSWS